MITEEKFLINLQRVQDQIAESCRLCGRKPDDVTLLPVTKNWPAGVVDYCKRAGIVRVGENRVQEALEKKNQISNVDWELIGHLQTNKAKLVVGEFARVQTVDSTKLLQKLNDISCQKDVKTSILLQVNAGKDPAKYGCSLEETEVLVDFALSLENLVVNGFMTIAPYVPEDLGIASRAFEELRTLRDDLQEKFAVNLGELSMGMSMDMKEAIAAGSTMVRVGSALFGSR